MIDVDRYVEGVVDVGSYIIEVGKVPGRCHKSRLAGIGKYWQVSSGTGRKW